MAALLVAMSVMAILLSVAIPTWSQMVRRDKEEELIFRGEQYARAINQYQRKFANQSPSSLDVLIEQRMLRKKFKDPLSPNKDGEFQMLYYVEWNRSTRSAGFRPGRGPQGSGPSESRWTRYRPTRHGWHRRAGQRGQSDRRQRSDRRWGHRPVATRRPHRRGRQQEHGTVDSSLQRQEPLQRVAVHRDGNVTTRRRSWRCWWWRRHATWWKRSSTWRTWRPRRAGRIRSRWTQRPRNISPRCRWTESIRAQRRTYLTAAMTASCSAGRTRWIAVFSRVGLTRLVRNTT